MPLTTDELTEVMPLAFPLPPERRAAFIDAGCGRRSGSFFLSGQISRGYASTNRRDRCATYQTVCGKRATLLDNADRANRNPRRGLELNNGRNVKRSAIRAWGAIPLSNMIDGRRIRAAWKAPQRKRPCRSRCPSIRRSSSRGADMHDDK